MKVEQIEVMFMVVPDLPEATRSHLKAVSKVNYVVKGYYQTTLVLGVQLYLPFSTIHVSKVGAPAAVIFAAAAMDTSDHFVVGPSAFVGAVGAASPAPIAADPTTVPPKIVREAMKRADFLAPFGWKGAKK